MVVHSGFLRTFGYVRIDTPKLKDVIKKSRSTSQNTVIFYRKQDLKTINQKTSLDIYWSFLKKM